MKPTTTVTLTALEKDVLVGLLASIIRDLGPDDPLAVELTKIKARIDDTRPDMAIAA